MVHVLLFPSIFLLFCTAFGSPPMAGDWCPWRPYDCQLTASSNEASNASLECKQVLVRRCCIDPSIHCSFEPRIRLAPARNECLTEACVVRAHWCPWSPWQGSNNTCGDIVRRRKRERCCHPANDQRLSPDGCYRGPGDDAEVDSTLETIPCDGQSPEDQSDDGADDSSVEGPAVVLVPGPTPGPLLVAAAAAIPVAFVLAMGAAVGFVVCCRRERQQRYHGCAARAYFCRASDRTPLCGEQPCEPPPSYEDSVRLTFASHE